MRAMILHHYGHVVGDIAQEFLLTVMDTVCNQEPIRDKGQKLIYFFRKVVYDLKGFTVKLAVTSDVLVGVQKIRDETVARFIRLHGDIWAKRSGDYKSYKGLLATAEDVWVMFVFKVFAEVTSLLLSLTMSYELYLKHICSLLLRNKGGIHNRGATIVFPSSRFARHLKRLMRTYPLTGRDPVFQVYEFFEALLT